MRTATKAYGPKAKDPNNLQVSDNTSTGHSLNYPAIKSCPGATEACKKICFGERGRMAMNGRWVTEHNWEVVQKDVTAVERIKWPRGSVNDHRLHGVGDLFSLPYARSLFRMCDQNPDVGFWMYTRSFQILRDILAERAIPSNLVVFISADNCNLEEAEAMGELFDLPVAYMGADVRPEKDAFVCPKTNGHPRIKLSRVKTEAACQVCRYCLERDKPKFVAYRKAKGLRFYEH